jgi:hypothetical protein
VVIKGKSTSGAGLAAHLLRTDTNERVEVKDIKGVVAGDLRSAMREMEAVAAGATTTRPFYHASINTRADEPLTPAQLERSISVLEDKLGLTGQPRIVVAHVKKGREHYHVGWSRLDLEHMTVISDSFNYRKHEEVARQLEREFGHEPVQGVHVDRDGKPRPKRTPSHSEMLQAQRTGVPVKEAKALLTEIWQNTKTGQEFREALWEQGWQLAQGDRRDFVALDPRGGIHSVARRIEGARIADVRSRWSDINPRELPTIRQARRIQNGPHARPRKERVRTPSEYQMPSNPWLAATQRPGPGVPARAAVHTLAGLADSLFKTFMGESAALVPKPKAPTSSEADSQAQLRQELLQRFSREVPAETREDAEIEERQKRDRGRGR